MRGDQSVTNFSGGWIQGRWNIYVHLLWDDAVIEIRAAAWGPVLAPPWEGRDQDAPIGVILDSAEQRDSKSMCVLSTKNHKSTDYGMPRWPASYLRSD